jgi:hypothetical protein
MPVTIRVATMASGTSMTVHDRRQAAYSSALSVKIARRPTRVASMPMTSIAGTSVPAETPEARAMSPGEPPSSSMRNGRKVKPLMMPT